MKKVVEGNTWNLIEKIAEEVAHAILVTYSNLVKQVDITVKKPWAPINLPLDTVSVEISRSWHTAYIALGSNMGDKKHILTVRLPCLMQQTTAVLFGFRIIL